MKPDQFIEELWGYAAEVPMEQHPWFDGIIKHRWSREQIILGEVQHYLRVRTNPIFFGYMAINAVTAKEYNVMDTVLENFMEELGGRTTHMAIMLQFLLFTALVVLCLGAGGIGFLLGILYAHSS